MSTTAKRKKNPEPRRLSRRSLERARPIAARYQVKLWREDGEWYGEGIEEPGAMGDGKTIAQCVRSVREAMAVAIASNLEHGEPVIEPIIDRERKRRRKAG